MYKTTLVAFLLLISNSLYATNIMPEINAVESQWARIYYDQSSRKQRIAYPLLLKKIKNLSKKHQKAAEVLIWQAIVTSTNAEFEDPFSALDSIRHAKELLESSIQRKPLALEGAAYVVLGTLYNMAPGWPISFGDSKKAEQLLKKGLEINPESIDANYFYADYLLSNNRVHQALKFFTLALAAPIRPKQKHADTKLKNEAQIALKHAVKRKLTSGRNNFFALFSTAKSKKDSNTMMD